jgi:hypothetical protein
LRSEPLILNKKGNLKYPRQVQRGKEKMRWLLVVTDMEGRNKGKKIRRYREARKLVKTLKKRYPDYEYTIVSRQVGYGPPVSRVSDEDLLAQNHRGRYWCPYCRKFRVFDWDPWWSKSRCPVCRIFDDNWHVMVNNPGIADRIWS